jgi:hypothetical protein
MWESHVPGGRGRLGGVLVWWLWRVVMVVVEVLVVIRRDDEFGYVRRR